MFLVIVAKYVVDKWGWWPKPGPRHRRSGQWRGIVSVGNESTVMEDFLSKGVGFVVAEGRNVSFWLDDWVGVGPIYVLFSRIFRVVANKESSVMDCYEERDEALCGGCPSGEVSALQRRPGIGSY